MNPSVRDALRLFGQGLSLTFWRLPRSRPVFAGFGLFLAACALSLALYFVEDHALTEAPASLYGSSFHAHASYFLLLLVASWIAVRILRRPALWLPLATLAVLVGVAWDAIALWVFGIWLPTDDSVRRGAWHILLALFGWFALYRCTTFLSQATPPPRRLAAGIVFALVLAWPWYWQQEAWFWYPPDAGDEAQDAADTTADQPAPAPAAAAAKSLLAPGVDAEGLMSTQAERVRTAVDAMRAQTPGKIDLFTIGFAGDGEERVFRNEVEYFDRLMTGRFGAGQRVLPLVNSPDTLDAFPLATLSNLRAALAGVGARMDRQEDVLVLFLTSHGSQDHLLYVNLDPLPLRQIGPADLRAALDDAHIGWRVIVVSACYSGGFVDALRDEHTLVITAAREDRASFGCGNDSKITWFGKAFLADALNQTTDFEQGFQLASRQIREWELRDGETPSVPQMATGWAIRRHLADWRKSLHDAPPVPFTPAPFTPAP
ncbi:hypothetical protein BH11PSE14_BH11PSE14_16860 [soil metagenome]